MFTPTFSSVSRFNKHTSTTKNPDCSNHKSLQLYALKHIDIIRLILSALRGLFLSPSKDRLVQTDITMDIRVDVWSPPLWCHWSLVVTVMSSCFYKRGWDESACNSGGRAGHRTSFAPNERFKGGVRVGGRAEWCSVGQQREAERESAAIFSLTWVPVCGEGQAEKQVQWLVIMDKHKSLIMGPHLTTTYSPTSPPIFSADLRAVAGA